MTGKLQRNFLSRRGRTDEVNFIQLQCQEMVLDMETGFELFVMVIAPVFYAILFWLVIRFVRAIERIADNVERIASNENIRE